MVYQSPCNSYALLLSARELVGFVLCAVGQTHEVEQFLCSLSCLLLACSAYQSRYHHVFERGEFGQQLVKLEHETDVLVAEVRNFGGREAAYVLPVNNHFTLIRAVECTHDLQQGGLSCTAWSHNGHHFASVHLQVDASQHLQRTEALGDSV